MNDHCPKEAEQQRKHSPGVVEDHETIVYILIEPRQWKGGFLTNAAFSKSELKAGQLSVCRANHSSIEQAHQRVVEPQLSRDATRALVGAFKATCSTIRAITADPDAVRAICVVDDGFEHYPAHAVLGFSDATKEEKFWNRNSIVAARANLMKAFDDNGGPLPLDTCFE